jgi:hypothetical protein
LVLQQLAIDQPAQSIDPILPGHLVEWLLQHEGFETNGLVPITLKDWLAVDSRDHAIDHFAGKSRPGSHRQQAERRS